MTGHRAAIYHTINDAAKATGIKHSEISRIMQKRRSSAGRFLLARREGPGFMDLSGYDFGEVLRAKNRQRPVMQYSKEGKPLQRFDSIKPASEMVGVDSTTVIGALKGQA